VKTLREYYQFLLSEAKKMEGEAPKDAEFGKFAFAPTRSDIPSPKEPNTKEEEEARQAIATYLTSNTKGPLDAKAKQLLSLQQQGYYSKVLDPSAYSEAYRFLRFTKKELTAITGIDPANIKSYGVLGGGTLVPHGGNISGWTVSTKLFTKDDFDGYGDGEIIAIFVAPIEGNNFFGNPSVLSKAVGEPHYAFEMETIAVGPVQYTKCSYALLSEEDMFNTDYFRIRVLRMLRNAGLK
jgi:hypothetical protein